MLGRPLTWAWLLMLTSFSLPGREGAVSIGAIDWVAALKVGTRALALVALLSEIARQWRQPRRPEVTRAFWPLGLFVLWALMSTLWSPLKAATFGQSLSMSVLFLLAVALALGWREAHDSRVAFGHLAVGFLMISLAVLVADLVSHDLSGLNRDWEEGGSPGLWHPTTIAATASLGLIMLVALSVIEQKPMRRALLVPAAAVHVAILMMAVSRMALFMTAVGLALVLSTGVTRRQLASATLAMCLLGVVYPIIDPGFEKAAVAMDAAGLYLTRGESGEQLRTLSGRTELWQAVWASFLESPVLGHGFHVASADGELDVFGGPSYRTAHNALLHVLVSTGLIGTVLVLVGFTVPIRLAVRRLRADERSRRTGRFLLVLGCWYLGWSQLSESFMGQLAPESVLFFCALGVAIGQAAGQATGAHPVLAVTGARS